MTHDSQLLSYPTSIDSQLLNHAIIPKLYSNSSGSSQKEGMNHDSQLLSHPTSNLVVSEVMPEVRIMSGTLMTYILVLITFH